MRPRPPRSTRTDTLIPYTTLFRSVEPEVGLPEVDREFYVMHGELYTTQKHGSSGLQEFSLGKLLDERPEHLMFNGSMDALTTTRSEERRVGKEGVSTCRSR